MKFAFTVENFDIVSVQVNGSTIFLVDVINGVPVIPATLGCDIAAGSNLSNGILNLQLDPVTTSNAGVYEMLISGTRKDCRTLYVLGMSNYSFMSLRPFCEIAYIEFASRSYTLVSFCFEIKMLTSWQVLTFTREE